MDDYERLKEAEKTILLLQGEIEALKSPPYLSGIVLDVGKKTTRVSIDGQGIYEVPSSEDSEEKIKRGLRVVLNPMTMAIIEHSEFGSLGGEVVSVDEVLDDKLKVQSKGESYIVLNSTEDVKLGDEVVLDPSGSVAIERFSKKKTRFALEKVTEAPWSNIGGLEETIAKIKEEVEEPFINTKIFEKYGKKPAKGILLYGPPGCGKTMIGKSIAYNLAQAVVGTKGSPEGYFININGPEILDKWVGNTEATIRKIYNSARETAEANNGPVVIFIDEAESILKKRGTGISTDVYDSIVPQFLVEMDGLNVNNNVITVLATNREDILDPAVLRSERVDRKIKVPRPNKQGAAEIFKIYLKDKPFSSGSKKATINTLVSDIYDNENVVYNVVSPSDGVLGSFSYQHLISGALIKGIVDRATTYAIQREIAGGKRGVSQADLKKAVHEKFMEETGFVQTLVRDDWENVFGAQGKQYQEACTAGYLILENVLQNSAEHKS